ncbi:hypothetical protein QBC35DRAFT_119374 [Podospora australis]|uniref:Uncharacterized protein n=1 Tax=Podospora australis TaxID=1536484 RepID=A0AAN7AE75_9PEZI|nr:hypothetical protein QBC35DRAFT_119374 [Podospora australis]
MFFRTKIQTSPFGVCLELLVCLVPMLARSWFQGCFLQLAPNLKSRKHHALWFISSTVDSSLPSHKEPLHHGACSQQSWPGHHDIQPRGCLQNIEMPEVNSVVKEPGRF